MLTVYETASTVLFIAAGVLGALAVVLFFALGIWQVIGKLAGARWVKVDEQEMNWMMGERGGRQAQSPPPAAPAARPRPVSTARRPPEPRPAPMETAPLMQAQPERPASSGTAPLAQAQPERPASVDMAPLAQAQPERPASVDTVPLAQAQPERPASMETVPLMQAQPERPASSGTVPLGGGAGGERHTGYTTQLRESDAPQEPDGVAAAKRKLDFQPEEKILVFHSEQRI